MQHRTPLAPQQGFTLVELVLTIVILGVLAVTALPRFADLSDEADQATFEGVKANFQTGVSLVYSTSLIHRAQQNTAGFPDVNLEGQCIRVNSATGYPLVDQSAGTCTPVASVLVPSFLGEGWSSGLYAMLRNLRQQPPPLFNRAHAGGAPPPAPPPAVTGLPGLLMDSDFTDWVWDVTPPFGTLTSPEGASFVYSQDTGKVN